MRARRVLAAAAAVTMGLTIATPAVADVPDGPEVIARGGLETEVDQGQISDDRDKVAWAVPSVDTLPTYISVRDRSAGTSKTVYKSRSEPNQPDFDLSGNGRYVAVHIWYHGVETEHVLLVRDTVTGRSQYVTGFGYVAQPSLSDSGRTLAFVGQRTGSSVRAVYVRNLDTGSLKRLTSTGATDPVISGNASKVAYRQYGHVYSRSVATGSTSRVDVKPDGTFGPDTGAKPVAYSDNGSFLAFTSASTRLVPNTEMCQGVTGCLFRRNFAAARTSVASILPDGSAKSIGPAGADLSGDGKVVAFGTTGPAGEPSQAYVRVLSAASTRLASANAHGEPADAAAFGPKLSADGGLLTFHSAAENFVDEENEYDLPWIWVARGK